MASTSLLYVLITFALLLSNTSSSLSDEPETFPISWPETASDESESPSNSNPSLTPTPSPLIDSPPADVSPTSAPTPEEVRVRDFSTTTANEQSNKPNENSSSKGMSGGKKAGIAMGVIAAACAVGFGGMLYEKRKHNIERTQLGDAASKEFF